MDANAEIAVGTSIATIVALVVGSGNNGDRVSSAVAWTQFENNTGWKSSTSIYSVFKYHCLTILQADLHFCLRSQPLCGL